ncbi:MAG: bile acid:sodium symporter family protein [Sedimentisphaerales bacterium]|nr:bile acid:sodium symporter family protein [Sedimentisphaerales bacterium]
MVNFLGMLNKALAFYTKYFGLWVVAFGILAYYAPGPFVALKSYNKAFFAVTMFGIGAVLSIDDFRHIFKNPIIVFIGSTAQFTIMPFGAFVIARIFGLPAELTAGLILTGSAPGAMASNVTSYIAKADVAYSVSLTTVSTLLCPLLTPGLTWLLADSKIPVPFWKMVSDVLIMVILPLFAGFAVRHYFKRQVERILPVFPAISVTFIIFICSLVIALNRDYLPAATGAVLATVFTLNLFGMASGYGVGALFRMNTARKRTLAIEIGMQNAGLGSALALEHLGPRAAVPAAFFVFVCIFTAAIAAAFWQRTPEPCISKISEP